MRVPTFLPRPATEQAWNEQWAEISIWRADTFTRRIQARETIDRTRWTYQWVEETKQWAATVATVNGNRWEAAE